LTLVVLLLVSIVGAGINYSFVKSPYREMAARFVQEARPSDGIIMDGPGQWTLAAYYLAGVQATYVPQDVGAAELVDIDPSMRAIQRAHAVMWVIGEQSNSVDPADNVARWLSLNAYPVSRQWFKTDYYIELSLSDRPLEPPRQPYLLFGEWLMLDRAALSTQNVFPGDSIAVRLAWHAVKKIPQPVQLLVTLRLFDQSGRVVSERVSKPCDGFCAVDDWIVGEPVDDRHGLLLPADAALGDYTLRLEVYAPREQRSLPIRSAQAELGSSVELARIHVQRPSGQ